jgi:hypothetical protein
MLNKKNIFLSILTLTLALATISVNAQTLDYSFVTVGCNRVDDVDSTMNKPSTANVYQLNRLFTEVSNMSPLPDYLFFTGDLVIGYKTDTVRLANKLKGWIALYKASALYGKATKLVAIPGNHEMQDKAAGKLAFVAAERTFVREMAEFIQGSNGPVATGLVLGTDSLTTDQSKLTYSFDYKGSHFVILNTDPVGRDSRVPNNWISNDIAAAHTNGAKHIFVFGHKPAYASILKPKDGLVVYPSQRNVFWNILEANHSEAMFAAHNHLWEKQQPHSGKTWQIIAGNGGSSLESGTVHPYFGYTLVNVYVEGNVTVESFGRDLNAKNYSYAADNNPTTLRESVDITHSISTNIANYSAIEKNIGLTIYPNPITNTATITFNLINDGEATVKIYTLKGYPVLTIVDEKLLKGEHQYTVGTQDLVNGAYTMVLVNNGQQITKKILITR